MSALVILGTNEMENHEKTLEVYQRSSTRGILLEEN